MIVYRVYYAWYDSYNHIGLFFKQEDAWIEADEYYKKHIVHKINIINGELVFTKKRLRGSLRTNIHIKKEEIK